MIHWADQIDIPKVSLLPLALIGVLVAYANWQRQKDAVKYGRLSIVAVAPFVAVLTVPIVNFPTFVIVLFCVVVASTVGVRHIPRRTRSDWGRNFLYAGILCNAVMLLMLKTLGLDQTPTYVIWVFLGLFGAAISTSLILFVLVWCNRSSLDNKRAIDADTLLWFEQEAGFLSFQKASE